MAGELSRTLVSILALHYLELLKCHVAGIYVFFAKIQHPLFFIKGEPIFKRKEDGL